MQKTMEELLALVKLNIGEKISDDEIMDIITITQDNFVDELLVFPANGIPSVFDSIKIGVPEQDLDMKVLQKFAQMLARGHKANQEIRLTRLPISSPHPRKETGEIEELASIAWVEHRKIYHGFVWMDDDILRPEKISEVDTYDRVRLETIYKLPISNMPIHIFDNESFEK